MASFSLATFVGKQKPSAAFSSAALQLQGAVSQPLQLLSHCQALIASPVCAGPALGALVTPLAAAWAALGTTVACGLYVAIALPESLTPEAKEEVALSGLVLGFRFLVRCLQCTCIKAPCSAPSRALEPAFVGWLPAPPSAAGAHGAFLAA